MTSLYHCISVLLVNRSAEGLHCLVEELFFVISKLLHFIFAVFILWNLMPGIWSKHFIKAKRPCFTVISEQLCVVPNNPHSGSKITVNHGFVDYCFIIVQYSIWDTGASYHIGSISSFIFIFSKLHKFFSPAVVFKTILN